jgi:chromodomain-helicase-DNA-binding protein 7
LRRLKEDVENSIPPKEEVVVEVELTSTQKKYYRAILERNRDFLNKGCQSGNVPNLINVVMQLRKVCNHPYMIPVCCFLSSVRFIPKFHLLQGVEEKESVVAKTPEEYYKVFIQSAGKLALLDKLLPKLHARGNKVLVFSQMVRVLDLLESYLRYHGWFYERLDGRIRGNERQAAIDRFSKPGSNRYMSTRISVTGY